MLLISTSVPIRCDGRLRRLTAQVFLLADGWTATYRLIGRHEQVCLVTVVSSFGYFVRWLLSHDAYLLDNSFGLSNIAIDLIEVVLSPLILRLLH